MDTSSRYDEVAATAMRHCEVLLQGVAGVPLADSMYIGRRPAMVVAVGHGALPVFVAAGDPRPLAADEGLAGSLSAGPAVWASRRRVALAFYFAVDEVRDRWWLGWYHRDGGSSTFSPRTCAGGNCSFHTPMGTGRWNEPGLMPVVPPPVGGCAGQRSQGPSVGVYCLPNTATRLVTCANHAGHSG